MPIQNISDIVRIPRLGKIRLGTKVESSTGNLYPKALDYFNCPEAVQRVFGDKPKELSIMFPLEDPDQFAQQWLRCYSMTQGLVCLGDGEVARAKVDKETAEIACHTTKEWVWKDDLTCNPDECPHYLKKHCRRVMNLQFLLPSVPGLGVWQIDTSSFYSIVNINSMIALLKGLFGRCSMIPLTLALGPVEVSPPGMKKKNVYIMHIRRDDIRLADLARVAQLPPGRVLIPAPEADEPPDDLFPQGVLSEELPQLEKAKTAPEHISPDKRRLLWHKVRKILSKRKTDQDVIKRWFLYNHRIAVIPEDFDQREPPDKFTEAVLSRFHEALSAAAEKSKAQKAEPKEEVEEKEEAIKQEPSPPESKLAVRKELTKETFVDRVKAVWPDWTEAKIENILQCPLDKWSEPWEIAVDVVEQIGGRKI